MMVWHVLHIYNSCPSSETSGYCFVISLLSLSLSLCVCVCIWSCCCCTTIIKMDESYYYYYCGGGGGGGNEAHFELALVLSADVSFCMDISNPSTLVDTHKTRQKGDAAAYLLFLKRQETRRRRRRRKVCRLKSFVRLLISNCHPSLAPPLVSDSLLIKKKRNCFLFFLSLFIV